MEYLGHIISGLGVQADPGKLQAIHDWPAPCSLTTLRAFLGLTGFYRRFVQHYATIASPLTDLLKATTFSWPESAAKAFTQLKEAMQRLPVLSLPDFSIPFEVTTDASSTAIGAVLSQGGHPIAFFSKKMCPRMGASSAYVHELYAITESVKKWSQYMLGSSFKIYTDHKSLKELMTQHLQTPEQQKWLTKLIGYTYEIHYKPGRENVVADALSRIPDSSQDVVYTNINSPTLPILDAMQKFYTNTTEGRKLITKVQQNTEMQQKFTYKSGLLYFKDRIFIPQNSDLSQALLTEFHASPMGGHSGIKATLSRLSSVFYWPGMHSAVKDHVNRCSVCQIHKYSTLAPYGLLQPLPIPSQVWEDISMDFITNLPVSANKTVIWVVVDRLTKFAHFVALPTSFTAASLASVFLAEIYKLHGAPKTIVSDRDKVFVSKFWRELFKILGTTLAFSSSYHPQTDGQTEVLNRCLETYLRCFVSDEPRHWSRFLALAEFWYNSTYHSAIGMTPFEALYGRKPPSIPSYSPGSSKIESLDASLSLRQKVLKDLKFNLNRARNRMIQQVNAKRTEKEFKIGDWVYLKLQPYRQTSVSQTLLWTLSDQAPPRTGCL